MLKITEESIAEDIARAVAHDGEAVTFWPPANLHELQLQEKGALLPSSLA